MTSIALNPSDTLHLVALDRPQLEGAHASMLAWVKARLDKIDVDIDVETTSLRLAEEHKFATAPFTRRLKALDRQRTFFRKILAAVEAGCVIVPNFPMTIFAIRTNAKTPRGTVNEGRWNRFVQSAQLLCIGDGKYVNPQPKVVTDETPATNAKGESIVKTQQWPAEEFEEVEFPIVLARPELMNRVGEAMAMKIFDEIGVAVDQQSGTRGDPILLGRILNPRGRHAPALTFFLGWYFDPSVL